jgi:hypothetical protein
MTQQTSDEIALKVERPVRRAVYALGALFVLAIGVLVVTNALVARRIHRINERGGFVKSWSPNVFEPFLRPFGWRVVDFFDDAYVVRQQYQVYFGDLDVGVGCGNGVTLSAWPEARFDAGDSSLAAAKDLHGILGLSLLRTSVTDAGLEHLRAMPMIESLDLGWTQVHGSGLEHLQGLPLYRLSLHATPLDDAGFEHLPELPSLRNLDLGRTRITGRSMARLLRYPQLNTLDLSGTPVTDDIVRDLSVLPIEFLDLSNTLITDAAIASLEKMPHLRSLYLCGTHVTMEAASRSSSDLIRVWSSMRDGYCKYIRQELNR